MPKPGTITPLTTYLSPPDADRLRDLAAAADRSVAAEIRVAVRSHLEKAGSPAITPGSRDNLGVEAAGNVIRGQE